MKKILITSIYIALACPLAHAQRNPTVQGEPGRTSYASESAPRINLQAIYEILLVYSFIQDEDSDVEEDEENLPFDDDSGGSSVMNWGAKLFLWFIYLSIALMILTGTWWSFTAKGFWSWVACIIAAFFYAMLLGRYWGYTACLISLIIVFPITKLIAHSDWGRKNI